MEPQCIWFCVGSRKGLRNLNFKAILHFRMNNSYLNILLIYAPLRYGSEFSLWQILNRKIFFSTLLLQTCYLLLTSQDGTGNLEACSNRHIFVLKKKSKIDPFLRNRKSRNFEVWFLNFENSEVEMAYMLLERLVGKIKKLESFKLKSFRWSWKDSV